MCLQTQPHQLHLFPDVTILWFMTKAIYILGATSGVATASWPLDWFSSVSTIAQFVFDAYFISFMDAVNFGTLCF
ncbi:MAG: hypothetical protein CMO26_19510 [Thiotrichales bacterium]|jgi:hypothetical protein|nr:hypothetical protein [Thiotrichales bacterium]